MRRQRRICASRQQPLNRLLVPMLDRPVQGRHSVGLLDVDVSLGRFELLLELAPILLLGQVCKEQGTSLGVPEQHFLELVQKSPEPLLPERQATQ